MEHYGTLQATLPNNVRDLPNTLTCPSHSAAHRYARNWYHRSNTFDATLL